jgi:hypothetical protein
MTGAFGVRNRLHRAELKPELHIGRAIANTETQVVRPMDAKATRDRQKHIGAFQPAISCLGPIGLVETQGSTAASLSDRSATQNEAAEDPISAAYLISADRQQ